jgi:SAM-dependent methyltransferase
MHISAFHYGKLFFDTYINYKITDGLLIVDIGAQDVNGSLRELAPVDCRYVGVDFIEGKGVDVVLKDPYTLPFETGTVDAVVCSSVYEHSEFFWLLFLETLRILKPTGLLYLNAPSNGALHRFPIDAWRFYPDAGKSLTNWARRNGMKALLLESFIGSKKGSLKDDGMWNDFVAVIARDENHIMERVARIIDSVEDAHSAYVVDVDLPVAQLEFMPDMMLIDKQICELEDVHSSEQRLRQINQTEQKEKASLLLAIREMQSENEGLQNEICAIYKSKSWRYTAAMRLVGRISRSVLKK